MLSTIANFYLWMSKGAHDVFALVINFLNEEQQPQHIIIRLFEANESTKQAMARNLIELLDQYDLRKKIVTMLRMKVQI